MLSLQGDNSRRSVQNSELTEVAGIPNRKMYTTHSWRGAGQTGTSYGSGVGLVRKRANITVSMLAEGEQAKPTYVSFHTLTVVVSHGGHPLLMNSFVN